jgi:hypothetical protein
MILPYWSRIWIAQEILLPDDTRGSSEAVKVFLGSRVVGFASLYHLVCELKDQLRYMGIGMWAENGESRMYHAYGGWKKLAGRQISSWPSFEINLPELLAVFRHCKSGDRRDRIFALLSLTEERPQIDIDYGMDEISLLKHVMERFMDGRALDELLWLGAALLEALEIRCLWESQAATEHDETAQILFLRPSWNRIRNPLWAETTLLVLSNPEAGEDHDHTMEVMRSVSFTISEAQNIHIFEYATQESEAGVTVKYARAHEYVRGQPAQVGHRAWQVEIEGREKRADELLA